MNDIAADPQNPQLTNCERQVDGGLVSITMHVAGVAASGVPADGTNVVS